MRFVLTGTMSVPRKELVQAIEGEGHLVMPAINSRTNYLVHAVMPDGRATNKLRKARQYGVTVIDEDQLYALLED